MERYAYIKTLNGVVCLSGNWSVVWSWSHGEPKSELWIFSGLNNTPLFEMRTAQARELTGLRPDDPTLHSRMEEIASDFARAVMEAHKKNDGDPLDIREFVEARLMTK